MTKLATVKSFDANIANFNNFEMSTHCGSSINAFWIRTYYFSSRQFSPTPLISNSYHSIYIELVNSSHHKNQMFPIYLSTVMLVK